MKKYLWTYYNHINYNLYPYQNALKEVVGFYEFPVDRFGITQGRLELETFNIVREPPTYNLTNLTNDWEDRYYSIVDQVADNVYKTAGDRKITVLYSGGVDSTLVLVALKNHPKYTEFLENNRFDIMLTSVSIEEYQKYFYEEILPNDNFSYYDINKVMNDPNILVVTGDMGDHVIGSSDVLKKNNAYFDTMSSWEEMKVVGNDLYNELYDLCVKSCPFEVISANQSSWWWAQCFDHQDDFLRPYFWSTISDFSEVGTNNKVFRFFYDDLFVKFSFEYMSTNPVYHTYIDNKLFPKKYICNSTGDWDYMNKIKIFSQSRTSRFLYKKGIYFENNNITYESSL